jgi:hypothetical protein
VDQLQSSTNQLTSVGQLLLFVFQVIPATSWVSKGVSSPAILHSIMDTHDHHAATSNPPVMELLLLYTGAPVLVVQWFVS